VTDIVFKSAREWLDAMVAHQCGRGKKMIPADNPRMGQLGFACVGCDVYFLLNVLYCNATLGELSSEERKMIWTTEGRLSMNWYLDGTVVQVREEITRGQK
jgi:hypothetical protein